MRQKHGMKGKTEDFQSTFLNVIMLKELRMKLKRKSAVKSSISTSPSKISQNEDGKSDTSSNGYNTSDSLISSRTSSDILRKEETTATRCYEKTIRNNKIGIYVGLVSGVLFIFWGISTFIFTPFKILLSERIRMTPGLPPYEWWLNPPDEVLLKVYLFNVTNSEQFLSGENVKLKVQEIGPIIYREKLTHKNTIFNENSTFSYTANRSAIFLPELNTINLNDTIVMPNLPVLLMPTYLYDASYFVKFGLNIMLRTYKSEPFVTTTIQDYLWNMTDPVLNAAEALAPNLVPTKNLGILEIIYSNFEDQLNVFIGSKYGNKQFFQIDKFEGSSNLPNRGDDCKDKITNSTEGLAYPQFLTKNDTLRYWRKTLCKVALLNFTNEERLYGVTAYRYKLIPELYNRTEPSEEDCYKGYPRLPSGLSDVSQCYFGMPVAASYPHFLYASETVKEYVDGLEPDEEKHGSYVVTEPITGIPLEGRAKSQINLVMRKLRGFNSNLQKFSDIAIPLAWLEYHQVGIPWYLQALIYFTVQIVPIGQYFFAVFVIILGTGLIYRSMKKRRRSERHLIENKLIKFETEEFLKVKN